MRYTAAITTNDGLKNILTKYNIMTVTGAFQTVGSPVTYRFEVTPSAYAWLMQNAEYSERMDDPVLVLTGLKHPEEWGFAIEPAPNEPKKRKRLFGGEKQ